MLRLDIQAQHSPKRKQWPKNRPAVCPEPFRRSSSLLIRAFRRKEIAVEGADELYKEIRIDNTLVDEKGQEHKLKSGAGVEVTIEADPQATVPKNDGENDGSGSADDNKQESHKAKGTGKS